MEDLAKVFRLHEILTNSYSCEYEKRVLLNCKSAANSSVQSPSANYKTPHVLRIKIKCFDFDETIHVSEHVFMVFSGWRPNCISSILQCYWNRKQAIRTVFTSLEEILIFGFQQVFPCVSQEALEFSEPTNLFGVFGFS